MRLPQSFRAELMQAAAEMVYGKKCLPENRKLWKKLFFALAYNADLQDVHNLLKTEKRK